MFRFSLLVCTLFVGGVIAAPTSAAWQKTDTITVRTEKLPEIEVLGERPIPPGEISKSAYELAQSNTINEPIARFHDPLCLSVSGLGKKLGDRVARRIHANARSVSIRIDEPGCSANALVMVVDNPAKLIERMRDWQPRLFSPRANHEIRAALHRGDPVIGWSQTVTRGRTGRAVNEPGGGIPGAAGTAIFDNAAANVPTNTNCLPSRLVLCHSYARAISVVIFDVRELEDVHIDQLADYATMYLIGSPRRLLDHEKLAAASIMTLFKDGPRAAPQALTALDRAYLGGLYSLRPNARAMRLPGAIRAAYLGITQDDKDCEGEGETCSPDQ